MNGIITTALHHPRLDCCEIDRAYGSASLKQPAVPEWRAENGAHRSNATFASSASNATTRPFRVQQAGRVLEQRYMAAGLAWAARREHLLP